MPYIDPHDHSPDEHLGDLSGIKKPRASDPVHQPSADDLAQLILDTAEEGFCLFSAGDQKVVAYNQQFAEYLNLDPAWLAEQPTAEDVAKAIYEREQPRPGHDMTSYLRRILDRHRRDDDWNMEMRLADGRTIVGRTQAAPTGERLYTARDITQVRHIMHELEEERARLSRMVEHAPAAYYVIKCDDLHITEVSRSIEFLTGHSVKSFLGGPQSWVHNAHDEDLHFVRNNREPAIRDQQSFDIHYRRIHKDGSTRWFREMAEVMPRRSGQRDQCPHMAGVLIDITRQKVAEANLRDSERRFREIIEGIPDLIFYEHDPDRFLTYLSPSVNDILDFAPHEMIGKRFGEISGGDEADTDLEQAHRYVAEAIRTGRRQPRYEIRVRNKVGEQIMLEIFEYPVVDTRGKVVGFRGVARDITTMRTLERKMRERERLAILGTFAGGLAHDLNNLLLPIRASLETLERSDDPKVVAERAEAIRRATEHIGDLVKKLLFWTRQDSTMAQRAIVTNLRGWANEVVKLYFESVQGEDSNSPTSEPPPPIRVDLDYRDPQDSVSIDPDLLTQAVLNLVFNARDAMPKGGKITIIVDRAPDDWATHLTAEETGENAMHDENAHLRDAVRFTVVDEGIGMDESVIDRAFDPFFSTKTRGKSTGLGLALVRTIVQTAGGTTQIESTRGVGTSIHIDIPTAYGERRSSSRVHEAGRGSAVIRVSDPMSSAFIANGLDQLGFDTRTDLHGFPEPADRLWVIGTKDVDPRDVKSIVDRQRDLYVLAIGTCSNQMAWPATTIWHEGAINTSNLRDDLLDLFIADGDRDESAEGASGSV